MNPDNPNFRTPEEEARVAELVKLKAENETLKQMWERATQFVMPGEKDTGESIEHYIKKLEQTIATQTRVIEKLKEFVNARGHHENCIDGDESFSENETCECGFSQIAAIERAEGEKEK
jgi:transcriptional accessory protein Tex/SPT6